MTWRHILIDGATPFAGWVEGGASNLDHLVNDTLHVMLLLPNRRRDVRCLRQQSRLILSKQNKKQKAEAR